MAQSKLEKARKNMKALETVDLNEKGRRELRNIEKRRADRNKLAHNRFKKLEMWHIDLIKDRYLFNMQYKPLAEKYNISKAWAATICKSDVGIKAAQEIINSPPVELIRNKLKHLSGSAFSLCAELIEAEDINCPSCDGKGTTGSNGDKAVCSKCDGLKMISPDGIGKLDRGKFALDIMRMAGIPEVKEHKFTFEHVWKKAGEVVAEAGEIMEGELEVSEEAKQDVVQKEVLKVALEDK